MTDDTLIELLSISPKAASRLRNALLREGYWRQTATSRSDYENYENTEAGYRVAGATALRPITRVTADRLLQGLIDRMIELETRSDFVFILAEAVVFGSYVSGAQRLSDIDVGYRLRGKAGSPDADYEAQRERSRVVGTYREFRNPVDDLMWPKYEVLRFLQNRSGYISLHDLNDEEEIVRRGKSSQIYPPPA